MLHDRKEWNLPFLNTIFDQKIVDHIINIPFYRSIMVYGRQKENNGEHSIGSAYRFCIQDFLDPSHFKVQGSWNLIWKLKVPPKVKNFMWCIFRKCLPTRMRLKYKEVTCSINCAFCTMGNDYMCHLFF
jgi:hypothetical protein